MPLWDFKCSICGYTHEYLRSANECAPTHCDDKPMERQQAAPSFVVKGYNAKNHYSQTTRDLPSSVHGQKDTKVTVSGNL